LHLSITRNKHTADRTARRLLIIDDSFSMTKELACESEERSPSPLYFLPAVLRTPQAGMRAWMLVNNRIDRHEVVLCIGASVLHRDSRLCHQRRFSRNRSSINWMPCGSQYRLDTAGGFLLSRRNLLQGLVKVCIRWEWRPGQGEIQSRKKEAC
jgi:hypothetical protein